MAASAIAKDLGRLQGLVLRAIVLAGSTGMTDRDGQRLLALESHTYTPRRRELVLMGKVVDSGERRLPINGRCRCVVWVAR